MRSFPTLRVSTSWQICPPRRVVENTERIRDRGYKGYPMQFASPDKLTWLALGEDHEALSRRVEHLTALPRLVKPWEAPLGFSTAEFLTPMRRARARINHCKPSKKGVSRYISAADVDRKCLRNCCDSCLSPGPGGYESMGRRAQINFENPHPRAWCVIQIRSLTSS